MRALWLTHKSESDIRLPIILRFAIPMHKNITVIDFLAGSASMVGYAL